MTPVLVPVLKDMQHNEFSRADLGVSFCFGFRAILFQFPSHFETDRIRSTMAHERIFAFFNTAKKNGRHFWAKFFSLLSLNFLYNFFILSLQQLYLNERTSLLVIYIICVQICRFFFFCYFYEFFFFCWYRINMLSLKFILNVLSLDWFCCSCC